MPRLGESRLTGFSFKRYQASYRPLQPKKTRASHNLSPAWCINWAQREGGAIEEIHPGDVVWFSPGEKHWHGATPTTAMTHFAIQEKKDGKVVDWMEHVTDEQYKK